MLLQSWKLKDFNSSTYSFKCKVIIIGADINVCALHSSITLHCNHRFYYNSEIIAAIIYYSIYF